MSNLQIGTKVRAKFPVTRDGRYHICASHLPDAVDLSGQVGEVVYVRDDVAHGVGVVFSDLWLGGSPWSDRFKPDELVPA